MKLSNRMRTVLWGLGVLLLPLLAGCPTGSGPTGGTSNATHAAADEEADIKAALAKLSPADREAAEAQKFCPVHDDNRLGSMKEPVKLILKGQPVFLCCKACEKAAKADEDKTLAKVEQLKAQNKAN